ncbi:4169_t:CDS:2, partial [Scutellospora calospora]
MSNIIKRSCNSYTIKQKKEIVDYVTKYSRNEAARNFMLDSSIVGRWVTASSSWNDEINQNSKSSEILNDLDISVTSLLEFKASN